MLTRSSFRALRSIGPVALLALTACLGTGCSSEVPSAEEDEGALVGNATLPADYKYVWDEGRALPEAERWAVMYENANMVAAALNGGTKQLALKPKEAGGSSMAGYVDQGEARLGLWSPPNAATWVPEEIFAFNISRLFGHGEWAAPAVRLTLNETGTAAYKDMLAPLKLTNAIQRCNREHQQKHIESNPNYFIGVYKYFIPDTKPGSVPPLVANDLLNAQHSVAKFLMKGNRKPTSAPVYYAPRGSAMDIYVQGDAGYDNVKTAFTSDPTQTKISEATELDVAAQLNHMLVVDVLNGQRDRYGTGSNMSVFVDKKAKTFRLALVDNGGGATALTMKYVNDFKAKVTRFDASLAENVIALDAFVNKKSGVPFKGFATEDALKRALGYEDVDAVDIDKGDASCGSWSFYAVPSYKKRWDTKWDIFKKGLGIAAAHIQANSDRLTD